MDEDLSAIVVAADYNTFQRLCLKYRVPNDAMWVKPGAPLYGVRTKLIVREPAAQGPLSEYQAAWANQVLLTRLAPNGQLIQD
jgi:hypothetical protein